MHLQSRRPEKVPQISPIHFGQGACIHARNIFSAFKHFFEIRVATLKAQQKALHLCSRGLGGREGQLMAEIFIFCFPIFPPNMSGISGSYIM